MTPNFVSYTALAISVLALFFTFRKDAHRVILEIIEATPDRVVIGINNDSAFKISVLSVGYFGREAKVDWLSHVVELKPNTLAIYPIGIDARTLFNIQIIPGREIPKINKDLGYCVQLSTGRMFVVRGGATLGVAVRMHFASLLSRITAGRHVPKYIIRPRC